MVESTFQKKVKKEIKERLPECMVMKTDASQIQGIPDLLILYGSRWAALECKKAQGSAHRPNQDYYVEKMNNMSFSAFIYPENKEEVLNAMEAALRA